MPDSSELASSSGGTLDSVPVLREVPESAKRTTRQTCFARYIKRRGHDSPRPPQRQLLRGVFCARNAKIREAAQDRAYLSPLITKDLLEVLLEARKLEASSEDSVLTKRQREVLQLIAEGKTMKEVGAILKISQRTAESHKYEIMRALGVDNTASLVQYAIRNKLIS